MKIHVLEIFSECPMRVFLCKYCYIRKFFAIQIKRDRL